MFMMANLNIFGGYNPFMMPNMMSGFSPFSMPFFNFPMPTFNMPLFQMPMMPTFQMPLFQMPMMPAFNMPAFNTGSIFNTNSNSSSTKGTNQAPESKSAQNIPTSNDHLNGKHDLNWWKAQGYDEEMGKKLAADAVAHAKRDPGQCVGYVRRSLRRVYGSKMESAGAAYKFGEKLMSDPVLKNRWKKVDVKGLKDSEFPEGAIVLWNPKTQGYTKGKAALYGHGAIAHNGDGYANGVVSNLSTYAEVWIPIKA